MSQGTSQKSRFFSKIAAIAFGLVLIPFYQNCSSPNAEFTANSTQVPSPLVAAPPSSSYSGGNGGGYDGKPFVLPDLTRACTDGDGARSRIVEKAGVHRLIRLDCANLATAQVVTVTTPMVQIPGHDSIVYDDKIFDSQADLVSGAQLPTKGYCREVTQSATISVPQTVGTDFQVGLVIAVSGTSLLASMVFEDNSTSNDYATNTVNIGTAPATTGPLVGLYSYRSGPAVFDFNFVSGEAVVLGQNVPLYDISTPATTGLLVDFDSTLTKCTWN